MTAMSFSLMFSGCFLTLLISGHSTVVCLVSDNLVMQPATTVGYYPTVTTAVNATNGELALPFPCGNSSHHCLEFCSLCYDFHGAPTMDCLSLLLTQICFNTFIHSMELLNSTNWCTWSNVNGLYSNLSLCTEEISDCLLIPWPNSLVERKFVDLHTKYFSNCPTAELSDPPPAIVFALAITPIFLIPIMVSLVVLKTKNGDGSS